MARLQAGQLDASSAYKTQPAALGLPFIELPKEINLGDASRENEYKKATVNLNGKTLHPSPLVFYAAVLKDAPQRELANRFLIWLRGPKAKAIFSRYHYDAPIGDEILTQYARPVRSAWWARLAMLTFALALLYPLAGLCARVGPWQWDGVIPGSTSSAAWNSLFLTAIALVIDVVLGTPVAYYLARSAGRDRILWEAAVLISVLMPPLALGILLSFAFGPQTVLGACCFGWRAN